MQSLQNAKMKTPLQHFILELAYLQTQIQKADLTFIAILPNSYDQDSFDSYDDFNEYFMKKFYHAIHGKGQEQYLPDTYQQVTIQNSTIYMKQFIQNNILLRLVFIPAEKYDLSNDQVGFTSYIKMVKKFFLINLFMKPSVTEKIKLIGMDFIQKPASARQGKLKSINISQHIKKLFGELQKIYNLSYQQQLSKLTFLFVIEQVREPLVFRNGDDDKNSEVSKEILVMTIDNKKYPVHRLQKKESGLRLGADEIILTENKNLVEVKNYHLLFHYNEFINYKPTLAKDNILDQLTASQLWGVIQTIIFPLFRVKQIISDNYQLPQQEGKTKDIFFKIENQRWNSPKLIKNDIQKFNLIFDENKWIQSHKNLLVIKDQEQQEDYIIGNKKDQEIQRMNDLKKQQRKNLTQTHSLTQQQQKLISYTQHFNLYDRFINQQPNFIHSMILDQINLLSKDISNIADEIHKATQINKTQLAERKLLQLTKIIVRFLAQLKKHQMFSSLLEYYNPEFNQYLLEIYLSAYAQFCAVNKQIYGKLFDLSQKVADLKSTKKQLLKVVKSVNSFTQLYKIHTYTATLDDLQDKRSLLQILLRLLRDNKSQQKDKEIDTKIMSTQYDLGATYYKIALIQNYGNSQSKQLKVALKILYDDLYMKLFILRKDFDKEYATIVKFNELELLQKISGLLKLLDSIDLAIEVEKKLDNLTTVENYYNRWMMKYHKLNGTEDQEKIVQICQKAIQYFTIKFQISKVTHYYDLLIKNSMTFEQKTQWKTKRFRYLNSSRDPDWCKKGMQKAEKTVFPITEDTNKAIRKLYQDVINE